MPTTLTPRDTELLLFAIQCTKTEFAIDYEKFAKLASFKNKNTAAVTWGVLRKKLEAMKKEGGDASSPSPGGSQTPKSTTPGKGKKRKQVGGDADDDDEALTPSASKKGKRGHKVESPVEKDEEHVVGTENGGGDIKPEPED